MPIINENRLQFKLDPINANRNDMKTAYSSISTSSILILNENRLQFKLDHINANS